MEGNFKGQLIEFCLKNSESPPRFDIPEQTGPPHDRVFLCKIFIDDKLVGEAKAKNKKSAEHEAAKVALQVLGNQEIICQPNYISLLNQLSQKKNQSFSFVKVSCAGPAHNLEFTFSARFGDKDFPLSRPKKSKRQAEKEAAYLALQELRKQFPNDIPELPEFFIDESESENSSMSGSVGGDINGNRSLSGNGVCDSENYQDLVALLHQFCQKQKWTLDFKDGGQTGPAHNPQFSSIAMIGSRSFPESSMKKTKKQAKKEASFFALKELKSEFPRDIPNLPDVFIDDSMTGQSSASSAVNNTCIRPSSESRLHNSDPPNSESQRHPSSLTPSNLQSHGNQPASTDSGGGSLQSSSARSGGLKRSQSLIDPMADFDSISPLDKGAYGYVVKARKILEEKFYAVKIVQVKGNKVLDEVKVLARLEHQHIVRYYNAWLGPADVPDSSEGASSSSDFSRTGTSLYIQMELCENGSLKKWIKKRNSQNKVNKSQIFEIFRQVIEGVKYIHSEKLIHRDLKPGNILFTKDMTVKIGDFGLVTRMTGEEEDKALERTRGTGTASYMAPEQKDNKYENEVDIYPLGLILFELLWIIRYGQEKAILWRDLQKETFPTEFEEQHPFEKYEISKMLSRDPKKRPSAEDLSESFQKMKILDSQTR